MNKLIYTTNSFFFSYGIQLAAALTKLVIERGYIPFVAIRPENDASRSLYKKLGFENAFQTARVIMQPHETNNSKSSDNNNVDEGIEDSKDDIEIVKNHSNGVVVQDEGVDIFVDMDKED